jgi:selenocysteine lyase/cysteine desulfurase
VGVTAVRRDLLEEMGVYRLDPAPDYAPDRLETGTQNHEGIAGVKGARDFIASLGAESSTWEWFVSAMHKPSRSTKPPSPIAFVPGCGIYLA